MQRVFFGKLWVTEKACFWGRVALKRISCLQQMFKMMPSRMHTVVLSIDQRPCRRCSAECFRDAITVTWKTRRLHHFISEQNKVRKIKVVKKL